MESRNCVVVDIDYDDGDEEKDIEMHEQAWRFLSSSSSFSDKDNSAGESLDNYSESSFSTRTSSSISSNSSEHANNVTTYLDNDNVILDLELKSRAILLLRKNVSE